MFVQFFRSHSAEVHCSIEWQHGRVIVCLYSGGTSLAGGKLEQLESGRRFSSLFALFVERVGYVDKCLKVPYYVKFPFSSVF